MQSVQYSRPLEADRLALTVPAECAGLRLDQALALLMPEHSRSRLKAWIDAGRVVVDGAPAAPRRKLMGGERIDVDPDHAADAVADAPQAIALHVVHEDAATIVVDKPAGLVVHPGAGNRDGTLLNALLHRYPGLAAVARAGIVHRLDKDTSGLMVVARTPEAQTDLVRQLAARTVKREYVAVVRGDVAKAATIDAPIGRHPVHRTSMAIVERGREARTHVAPIERFGTATFIHCVLDTGRTHQIRVHLTAIGHPLVGDPVYGARKAAPGVPPFGRQALHAQRLGYADPATREARMFEAPMPADLAALLDALRRNRA
ncbi:MAG: RluA family pseudouridine synthase [Betaproteobacteria bacterium]